MRLAILHHHLDPGGVTRVVAAHLRSLDASPTDRLAVDGDRLDPRVVVLSGPRTGGWEADTLAALETVEVDLRIVPELEYDDRSDFTAGQVVTAVRAALDAAGCGPGETLLHVHNHSLGKSVAFAEAVPRLADAGYRLLLQTHDFCEDFRPELYRKVHDALGDRLAATLYPDRAGVHYATLQSRDMRALAGVGLPPERLHVLPNPAPPPPELPTKDEARRHADEKLGLPRDHPFWLYPVRGIRRKNLGEIVLLSVLKPDVTFGVSLAPTNPVERPFFDHWRDFAAARGLPVLFDVGGKGKLSFEQNLAASDALVTTSVAEGFGMVFVEPWLIGRPLYGRDLPEILHDDAGRVMQYPNLYERLPVALNTDERQAYRDAVASQAARLATAYGRRVPDDAEIERAVSAKFDDGDAIDFADLDEPLQERVIDRLIEDDAAREAVRAGIAGKLNRSEDQAVVIEANAVAARHHYGLEHLGGVLRATYHAVMHDVGPATGSPPNADALLDRFVGLDRLRLIRGLTD